MLHDLLAHDLSQFDVRRVPQTEALTDQKLRSLGSIESWWFEVLSAGELPAVDHATWMAGPVWIATDSLHNDYLRHAQRGRAYRPEDRSRLARWIKTHIPNAQPARPRADNFERKPGYKLPPLDKCRLSFEEMIGAPVTWDPG